MVPFLEVFFIDLPLNKINIKYYQLFLIATKSYHIDLGITQINMIITKIFFPQFNMILNKINIMITDSK